jgi:hypothetical protein
MVGGVDAMIKEVSEEFNMPQDELLKQGIRTLLERRLREVKAEIFEIAGKYNVAGVSEMESRYREGSLEEADSWRDLQSLDHLEYKRDRLIKLIENLS